MDTPGNRTWRAPTEGKEYAEIDPEALVSALGSKSQRELPQQ